MQLSLETVRLLETVEAAIDPAVEDAYLARWDDFIAHRTVEDIFSPVREKKAECDYKFRGIRVNDAIHDKELMLVSQMEGVLRSLTSGCGVLNVRANYGTGILTSVFGAPLFVMPKSTNTLPITRSIGLDAIPRVLEAGVPDLTGALGGEALSMGECFREVFSRYPKIEKYVTVYHPDTQGPLDLCELLFGTEILYLPYDDPDALRAGLGLMSDTIIAFLEKWYTLFPKTPERSSHWGSFCHKGCIVLRDDSAMNVSPDIYREFVLPFDSALLGHFDGGVIHFCGRGDHYIDIIADIPTLYGINMSQPEYNDMEKIYRFTVDRGIPLYSFSASQAQKDIHRPGAFHNCITVSPR